MNIYIYDDKKGKTEIIEIEESKYGILAKKNGICRLLMWFIF